MGVNEQCRATGVGMLLPDSLERDLSHTSILYYRNILYNKIFEHSKRVISKNNFPTLIRHNIRHCLLLQ